MRYRSVYTFIKVFILFMAIVLGSCNTEKCLHSTGATTSLYVETGYFKKICIRGIFEILLVQDTTYYVEFIGGSNVLDYAQTQNIDSVLTINNTNECLFLRDYEKIKLKIYFEDIKELNLLEPSTVKSQKPITTSFTMTSQTTFAEVDIELNNKGFFFYSNKTTGGLYTFRGSCDNCSLMGFSTAKIDAGNLRTREMHIKNFSIADYYVNVEEKLSVEIHNLGNVIYYGSPIVQIDSISGTGRVIRAGDN
jgi:hypothetical protein